MIKYDTDNISEELFKMSDNYNETTVLEEEAKVEPFELGEAYHEDEAALAKKKKWKAIWDKVTTGILIFLMAAPILILAYIVFWFMTK